MASRIPLKNLLALEREQPPERHKTGDQNELQTKRGHVSNPEKGNLPEPINFDDETH